MIPSIPETETVTIQSVSKDGGGEEVRETVGRERDGRKQREGGWEKESSLDH